ncbi:MAG TPA: ATP-dependent DNA ligase [Rhizomicrobium sp.]
MRRAPIHSAPIRPRARAQAEISSTSLSPIEARLVSELPRGGHWQFEPKWDGFRCLAFRRGPDVELRAKSGKPLTRYFPEIAAALAGVPAQWFVLDGELLIAAGESLSFDSLQMRLPPAQTRVEKLSRETPAILMLFDMLEAGKGNLLLDRPLSERRKALETFYARNCNDRLRLSPFTTDGKEAKKWLAQAGRGALDGVIAKPLDEPYRPGERAMLKIKCLRTADCVVGGFRYASGSRDIGSLLLGLYNEEGQLDHVGFTSGIADRDQPTLQKKLARLRGGAGFSGAAPGGPSRWSTDRSSEWEPLKPALVAEVRYDHVTGRRFRHGTAFLRWRPDKRPEQCTFDQLQKEARPGKLLRGVLSA